MSKTTFIGIAECAAQMHFTPRGVRYRFSRTGFAPAMVINQVRFYMRKDFEQWIGDNIMPGEMCTQ